MFRVTEHRFLVCAVLFACDLSRRGGAYQAAANARLRWLQAQSSGRAGKSTLIILFA
jgi:hypothetical protein